MHARSRVIVSRIRPLDSPSWTSIWWRRSPTLAHWTNFGAVAYVLQLQHQTRGALLAVDLVKLLSLFGGATAPKFTTQVHTGTLLNECLDGISALLKVLNVGALALRSYIRRAAICKDVWRLKQPFAIGIRRLTKGYSGLDSPSHAYYSDLTKTFTVPCCTAVAPQRCNRSAAPTGRSHSQRWAIVYDASGTTAAAVSTFGAAARL